MGKLPMNADILPPSDDHIFKTLLMHPDAKPALVDLVSTIIGRDVKDVQIRNNELPATDVDEKAERLDVNCVVVDNNDQANIEMQGSRIEESQDGHVNFINKYIYYLTDLHSSQKSKGIRYCDLARTYQVVFCTYTVFVHREGYITQCSMRTEDGEQISDQINMLIIELSKLGDVLKKSVDEMTSLEMWSAFLGYASDPNHRELINEIIDKKEVLGMASAVLTAISKDEHERAKFMSRRKAETDRISNELNIKARIRMDIARNLKAMGMSSSDIVKATGLTITEIEGI